MIKENEHKMRSVYEGSSMTPKLHLIPPCGWINDPNGLCQVNGIHHIFFQYSPFDARGGDKYWGHYQTKDFLQYEYTGAFLSPDTEWDRDGVYSGSAFVDQGKMNLFYTGNTKEEGDHDFIYSGRGANTILVTTRDGMQASEKRKLMGNEDYPAFVSCHVRDPKVWKEGNNYYMVLGARTKEDQGLVMLYDSDNLLDWHYLRNVECKEPFGFMWECPDAFTLAGKRVLSLSPQGLEHEEYRYQNTYQSGYFLSDALMELTKMDAKPVMVFADDFREWDMGFDFYAPQTYEDAKGRRILIGWMGVPDAEYDHDPSIDLGWQHMLTIPRELIYDAEKDCIRQIPISEFSSLRREQKDVCFEKSEAYPDIYELEVETDTETDFEILFDDSLELVYKAGTKEILLRFKNNGYGRIQRQIKMKNGLEKVRAIADTSSMELYLNDGEYVMTTKLFLAEERKSRTVFFGTKPKRAIQYDLNEIMIK